MVHRDPLLHFAGQVSDVVVRAMNDLSDEGWRDLDIHGSDGLIHVGAEDSRAEIALEMPPVGYGDFAFPCFQLTGFYGAPPENVAFRLFPMVKVTDDLLPPELAGPYINFTIVPERFMEETLRAAISLGDGFGSLDPKGARVVLEHTSANPNGPLHVGRARNPIIGDTLARVMRLAGYEVETQYYLNDMGRQVVLLHWGYTHREAPEAGPPEGTKPDHWLVGLYQKGHQAAEEDQGVDAEVRGVMSALERGEREVVDSVREPALLGLRGIQDSLARLDVHHDQVVSESQFVLDGSVSGVMEVLSSSRYTEEEGGALALELESFGLQGRSTKFVFRRQDGTSLYTTRDLAYHLWKGQHGRLLVNVLGEDHKLEARHLELALRIMDSEVKVEPVFYAFVSLPEGKMSTREGRGVFMDDLMDEAVSRARKDTRQRRPELEEGEVDTIAEAVGLGAVRYNIVRVQPEKAMVFRWEEALNFEGASAPFIQYAHTRATSILRKAEEEGEPLDEGHDPAVAATELAHDAELALAKTIASMPRVVHECAEERKVHTMALYAERLASAFNIFYRDVPVLGAGGARLSRLLLVRASQIALANSLRALGIQTPQQM